MQYYGSSKCSVVFQGRGRSSKAKIKALGTWRRLDTEPTSFCEHSTWIPCHSAGIYCGYYVNRLSAPKTAPSPSTLCCVGCTLKLRTGLVAKSANFENALSCLSRHGDVRTPADGGSIGIGGPLSRAELTKLGTFSLLVAEATSSSKLLDTQQLLRCGHALRPFQSVARIHEPRQPQPIPLAFERTAGDGLASGAYVSK